MRRVLVVIPTLNEAAHIATVLEQLSSTGATDAEIRFVVADGGSRDETRAIASTTARQRPDVALLDNPARLQSAAVNLAVERLGDGIDYLIRCDAHADYPDGFIGSLLRSAEASGGDAVVVPMDSVGKSCFQRAVAWVSDSKVGSGGSAHRGGARSGFVDHGHHALFRIESFRRAGGYDPSFTHNEDAELDCRQRAYGSCIFLDAGIRLRYAPRANLRALSRQYFNYGKGRSRTIRRHPSSLRARQMAIPCMVVLTALCLLAATADPRFLAWPLLYVAILATTAISIAITRRSICGLLAAPAAAAMHFAWGAGFLWGLITLSERRWSPRIEQGAQ